LTTTITTTAPTTTRPPPPITLASPALAHRSPRRSPPSG
jgi:hypothetical protein